jgi:Tol biopolymer transport system component
VTSDGKLWRGLVKNGQNSGVLWSPDGQKFLFGKKDPVTQNYQLWVYNLTSGEIKNLGLFTTVDKAVWDKDSNVIYAAVPTSGAAGSTLTVDSFYRMDTATLDKKQYASSGASIDGRDLFLNATSDKLFFRNAQDGGLYYLDLTQ